MLGLRTYRSLSRFKRLFIPLILTCLPFLSLHSNAQATAFSNPDNCSACHARQYQEWLGSSHAYASISPTFNALEVVGNKTSNGNFAADSSNSDTQLFCQRCHTPVAVELEANGVTDVLPNYQDGSAAQRPTVEVLQAIVDGNSHPQSVKDIVKTALRGNSCDVCHQAIGPEHTQAANPFFYHPDDGFGGIANASFLFGSNNSQKYGPFADLSADGHDTCQAAEYGEIPSCISGVPENSISAEKGGYISSPEFCGSCHDVRPPTQPTSPAHAQAEGFLRLENLFTEWKESAWGGPEQVPGFFVETTQIVTCQDCHMSAYPYGKVVGERALTKIYPVDVVSNFAGASGLIRKVSSHYFTGVDKSLLGPTTEFNLQSTGIPNVNYDTQETLARRPYLTHITKYISNDMQEHAHPQNAQYFRTLYMPIGQHQRRVDLLKAAATLKVEPDLNWLDEGILRFYVTVENVGAGHNIPAGFSQERQFWVGLEVTDANGQFVYRTGYLDGPYKELQQLRDIKLRPDNLEINAASLTAAGLPTDPDLLSYDQFEHNLREAGPDQDLHFFGNEFKRRGTGAEGKGVEVFSPFLADEMDNSHSLEPFTPETFTYVKSGISPNNLAYPLKVKATLNFRAFPPRFLKGLVDSMDHYGNPNLLPDEVLERNQVIEMAKSEMSITAPTDSGDHSIISANGRCFDLPWNTYNNPSQPGPVVLWSCHGGANQDIAVKPNGNIVFKNGACLTVSQQDWTTLGTATSGAVGTVGVEACQNSSRQEWKVDSDGRISILRISGPIAQWCLERTRNSNGVGILTLNQCWDSLRQRGDNSLYTQQWFYEPSFRPIYMGKAPEMGEPLSQKCLQFDPGQPYTHGADLEISTCDGSRSQQWQMTEKGLLINASGRCIDINGADWNAGTEGASLSSWDCSEPSSPRDISKNQQWTFEAGGLRTAYNPNRTYMCMGTENGNTANGTAVTLYDCDKYNINNDLDTSSSIETMLWHQ